MNTEELVAAQIREIDSKVEVNKAIAERERANTELLKAQTRAIEQASEEN